MTHLEVPELSLVVLIGASGSGKSSFARRLFKPTEIVSSDVCRGIVSNDENSQAATPDAFDLVHYIVRKRLKNGLLTVVDATNVQKESRRPLIELARQYHVHAVAVVLNLPEKVCHERNAARPDRQFGPHVVRQHVQSIRKSLKFLKPEGFRYIHVLDSEAEVNAVTGIVRTPLFNNKKHETGPFDIIGDVHGCLDELKELLEKLGYTLAPTDGRNYQVTPPPGRKAVFLGDLVDRGPDSPGVLRLVMGMVAAGTALCVPGNHDIKFLRYLNGKNVTLKHGLDLTVAQTAAEPPEFAAAAKKFIDGLTSHYVLDGGRLVVAHAGLKQEMQGRSSGAVREFCLYGDTTGEIDEFGLPVRLNWAADYRGDASVVYGHTPVPVAEWLNRTIDIDTGCVFGGRLTALRYPEKELVAVQARQAYAQSSRPIDFAAVNNPAASAADTLLDLEDVLGKQIVHTRLHHSVTVREENAMAALEVMSRFAVNPQWLVYLPPTMSPTETSGQPDLLEHPAEAFAYYAAQGVHTVVCEEKHMGSRAVVVLCRNEETAAKRFGVEGEGIGVCYTRTGRSFFNEKSLEQAFLHRIRAACDAAGFWDEFRTDWLLLDCELMPWSAKAQALLQNQYAAVGAAATHALPAVNAALRQAQQRGISGTDELLENHLKREEMAGQFTDAYRRYCWPVHNLDDYKLAPFHLLATEGAVHTDKTNLWHMQTLARLCAADPQLLLATPHRTVELHDEARLQAAVAWWEQLTADGGEGLVIKPLDFVTTNAKGLVQPAVKCRGREYLRIIYGPEYTAPQHLSRLKARGLGGKRSLALREFALGVEGLERFVGREPLRRVHQCVFAILALESEPIDPRL